MALTDAIIVLEVILILAVAANIVIATKQAWQKRKKDHVPLTRHEIFCLILLYLVGALSIPTGIYCLIRFFTSL